MAAAREASRTGIAESESESQSDAVADETNRTERTERNEPNGIEILTSPDRSGYCRR
jgi:hypothetical protein